MSTQDVFTPPLIGPFVESNGLRGSAEHTGAAISWTSRDEAFRVDLIRNRSAGRRRDFWGFAQWPSVSLEQFLWECFEHSTRLTDFLNELTQYIHPSGGSPTLAAAGSWLNPSLVAHGFTLGIAKYQRAALRMPILWVFGGHAEEYGSRTKYSLVDLLDWTPAEVTLVRSHWCWGIGAQSLRRHLHRLVDAGCGPLLTAKGIARMEQVWSNAQVRRPKALKKAPERLNSADSATTSKMRKLIRHLPIPLSEELKQPITMLSDKAFVGLLRTCVRLNLQKSACTLLTHRNLPDHGRLKLLEAFIDLQWVNIWKICGDDVKPPEGLTRSRRWHYEKLMQRALNTANGRVLREFLVTQFEIPRGTLNDLIKRAFELGREDLVEIILETPILKNRRSECLLDTFIHILLHYERRPDIASRLLELGVRPIAALNEDDLLGTRYVLLEPENLPILKRALEFEPPEPRSLALLFSGHRIELTETIDWLISVSRGVFGHKERMETLVLRAVATFIRRGEKPQINVIDQAIAEGAKLADIPWSRFVKQKLISGRDWQREQGNWIDLMAHFRKTAKTAELNVLMKLKREPRRLQQRT